MTTYRWIIYMQQNIPCNLSFEVDRVPSLEAAREAYRAFCDAVGYDDCSMTLYAYSDEAWESAEEFRDLGCPFDYPDKVIERGPSGDVNIINA